MFISRGFLYPLSAPPQGSVQEGRLAGEFANEVIGTTGKNLLGQTCYSKPSPAELEAQIESTRNSNGANWNIVNLDWMPPGARPLSADPSPLAEGGAIVPPAKPPLEAPSATASTALVPPPGQPGTPATLSAAELQLRELSAQLAAEKARREEAERRAAEAQRQAAIKKADEQLRLANAQQLQTASGFTPASDATLREFDERQKAFEQERKAFAEAQARYKAEQQASANALQKWREDVAACSAGDTTRCGAQ